MFFFLRKCLWTWGLGDGWLCLSALSWRWTTSPLTENWPPFSSRSCTWKSFHNAILEKVPFKRYLPVFSNVNYYVNDVINLFYFQHLTICFISYLTWSSIRRTRRKSWAIFWRAPSPMTASRQNSFTGELFELFFEWRIGQILTHVKNNFHLATHVLFNLF